MTRAPVVRAIIALAVVVTALFAALTIPARLGLDLRGGTQIVLEARDSPEVAADATSTDRALEVLRKRVDALGVAEPSLTRSGERRIIVELPGLQDPRKAAEVIGQTAQLTFHPVLGELAEGGDSTDESGQPIRIGPAALTGDGVDGASASLDQQSRTAWIVTIDFTGQGEQAWQRLTAAAACAAPGDPGRRIAIMLDDRVISSPAVETSVGCDVGITGGATQITGTFTADEAKDLAALVEGGALPVPVEVIEQRTVGPTLGDQAIEASAKAAVVGVVLTGLFIVMVYRLVGALATVALASYALLSYATLVALGATLTLPGLAGFVLAIGMAVDANVLVFERAREAYAEARRKSLRGALVTGFGKAWSAIVDSNVTTLLAAGLLFLLASGPVRGFGVTLGIGVLASMVSALVITRVLAEWALNRRAVQARPAWTGLASTGRVRDWLSARNPDVTGRPWRWMAVAVAATVLALSGIVGKGLDLGVEFTGGRLVEYSTSRPVDVDDARAAVSDAGFPRAVVQTSGSGASDNISVRTGEMTNDEAAEVRSALGALGGTVTTQRDELIGPSLGAELRQKALIALGVALGAQLLYLAVRFRWTFGASAVTAMLHDVIVVTGVFAWLGKPLDGVFLAALLTVIGYSVNDSVVVFDRVRELVRARPRDSFARLANTAVLQTVPRTVNTGMGALFVLVPLLLLGGDSLTDFALALVVGILVGTWSSVFTATPLAVLLERRWPAGRPADGGPRPAGAEPAAGIRVAAGGGSRGAG